MKISIINQFSSTGGWAYLSNLVLAMKESDSNLDVEIFTTFKDAKRLDSWEYVKELMAQNISVINVDKKYFVPFKYKNKFSSKLLNLAVNMIRKAFKEIRYPVGKLCRYLQNTDVIFYSWPYGIAPLPYDQKVKAMANKKVFFIPHDFIYTHCFYSCGGYSYKQAKEIYRQHGEFLAAGIPIVSTNFIKEELKRTFPDSKNDAKVVYLSGLNNLKKRSSDDILDVLKKYNVDEGYIISANNWGLHKNLGQIISAMYLVRKKYPKLKLLLTGYGTETFSSAMSCSLYGDWITSSKEVSVLGMDIVDKSDFSALLQGAKLAVTSSLCEAGSGMALDAWTVGTPVVMSNIESFREQVKFFGTRAEFCNPRNNEDIARAILKLLDNPDIAKNYANVSEKAMKEYTWDNVAKQYLKIFKGRE